MKQENKCECGHPIHFHIFSGSRWHCGARPCPCENYRPAVEGGEQSIDVELQTSELKRWKPTIDVEGGAGGEGLESELERLKKRYKALGNLNGLSPIEDWMRFFAVKDEICDALERQLTAQAERIRELSAALEEARDHLWRLDCDNG